jgi:hypothetical protein
LRSVLASAPVLESGHMSAKRFRQLWVGKQTFKTLKALADHDPSRTWRNAVMTPFPGS